jgi:hypothetical protein
MGSFVAFLAFFFKFLVWLFLGGSEEAYQVFWRDTPNLLEWEMADGLLKV